MRRKNIQTMNEVLRDYIREMKMEHKLKEVDVINSWDQVLGKTISRYTRNIDLSNGVLSVEINSSVVKNELVMMREDIRCRMNELAGEEIIKKIIFK